eukprot:181492-Lingulodinium_polyedra.AAC.1
MAAPWPPHGRPMAAPWPSVAIRLLTMPLVACLSPIGCPLAARWPPSGAGWPPVRASSCVGTD